MQTFYVSNVEDQCSTALWLRGGNVKSEQLSILTQEVGARLKEGLVVDEALLRDLVSAIADLIVESQETTEVYDAFSRDLEAMFAYGDVAESPAFSAGASWGMASVYASTVAKESESARNDALRDAALRHHDLLLAICDNPGITQQDLARKLDKKKSNLAQILARLERHRLFVVIPSGRFKKYQISSLGKSVLEEIEVEEASLVVNRSFKRHQRLPRGMEMMKLDAIVAHNEHRNAVIDTSEHDYYIPVALSAGYIEASMGDHSFRDADEAGRVPSLQGARGTSMPRAFEKSHFDATPVFSNA